MQETTEPRDVELLRRLASGDEDAFTEFYRRHQGGLYQFALHMTGRPEAAADVVQETFLALMHAVSKFNERHGTPAAFLFGIARNHVRKAQEKDGRYVALSEDGVNANGNGRARLATLSPAGDVLHDKLARAECVERLRLAVLTLPDHYREAVTLCDLEGKSYAEAAMLLGCPVGTVRSRLNRARDLLVERLRPACAVDKPLAARSGGKT